MGGTDYLTGEVAIHKRVFSYIATCMTARGFRYTAESPNVDQIRRDYQSEAFGGTPLANAEDRARYGYGVTKFLTGDAPTSESAPVDHDTEGLSAAQIAQREAILETCAAEAHKNAIPGDLLDQFTNEEKDLARRVLTDDAVIAARTAWSQCMAEQGYSIQDMDYATQDLEASARKVEPGSASAEKLHRRELVQAKSDWDCRERSFNATYRQVRDREQLAFINAHPDWVAKVRDEMTRLVHG